MFLFQNKSTLDNDMFLTYPKWIIRQKDPSANANVIENARVQNEHEHEHGPNDDHQNGSVHHLQNKNILVLTADLI